MLSRLWAFFSRRVFVVPSRQGLFNQYRDDVPGLDVPGGHLIRRQNLRSYLGGLELPPRALVVGEAAGPWGCRFSGVPFSSERQLRDEALPFRGRPSSLLEPPALERSATVFWSVMRPHYRHFLLYNAVPLHPHRPGEPLSIRRPSQREVREFVPLLEELLELLAPPLVVAVGRVAQEALQEAGAGPVYVRHPSQAGARAFRDGMSKLFA
jgi:hypothetical protein